MAHISQSKLREMLEEAKAEVKVGGSYYHYKDAAKTYVVRDIAILEATEEPCVIYEAQYDEKITFVRPLSEWLEFIENDGQKISRFALIE